MAKKESSDPLLLDFGSQLRELNKFKIEGYKPPKFKSKKRPIRFRARKLKKRSHRVERLSRSKGVVSRKKKSSVMRVVISRKAKSKKVITTREQQMKRNKRISGSSRKSRRSKGKSNKRRKK